MADAETPNFGYTLPTVGLDRDVWGDLLNGNWTKIDADLKGHSDTTDWLSGRIDQLVAAILAYVEPVGSMKPWPTTSWPAGWAPCDGWAIDRSAYAELFAVIGTTWGAGDGSTTFNLPDFRDCTPVHRGAVMPAVAAKMGEATHTLGWNEMPQHNHGGYTNPTGDHNHAASQTTISGGVGLAAGANYAVGGGAQTTGNAGNHYHDVTTYDAGQGAPHNNMQPSVGVCWIIKLVHQGF